MKTPVLSAELRDELKRLRLGRVLDTLADRLVLAEKQDLPLQDFLLLVLTDEIARRQTSAALRRADDAGLDPDMVFERRDKTSKVPLDRRVVAELSSLRFVEGRRNVVILGPVGVGKTLVAHTLLAQSATDRFGTTPTTSSSTASPTAPGSSPRSTPNRRLRLRPRAHHRGPTPTPSGHPPFLAQARRA